VYAEFVEVILASFDRNQSTMAKSNISDAKNDLSPHEICQRLSDLGIVLCEADGVLVCIHYKHSL
jgi:hypothetical protein